MSDALGARSYSVVGRWVVVIALFCVLSLPFINKPVHIDDANFLMLAEGASLDVWRPHSLLINWSGVSEPAFDILSNPPGIAWYLLPVRDAPEWVMHAWMLPWLLLGAWGCFLLSVVFTEGDGFYETLFLLTCPVVVLSSHALTPDLPAFACMSAGVGGYVASKKRSWLFALLAGSTVLFRYSGGLAIPFLFFIGWLRGGFREALKTTVSAIPVILLSLHDLHAYGEIHLLTMFVGQNDSKGLARTVGNVIAGIAMLGGVGLLPVLVWRLETLFGAVVGASIGLSTAYLAGQSVSGTVATTLFTACGVAALTLAVSPGVRHPILSIWAIGGALFFFVVRFGAARYWAVFIPGVALLGLRNVNGHRRWLIFGLVVNVVVSCLLAIDDQNHARAYQQAAFKVADFGRGEFSGHWGWQHYLSKQGWRPLERGAAAQHLYARGTAATQQNPGNASELIVIERLTIEDHWWGPRMHAPYAQGSYHASTLDRFAPWTFSNEPYDSITVYERSKPDE